MEMAVLHHLRPSSECHKKRLKKLCKIRSKEAQKTLTTKLISGEHFLTLL